MSDVSTRAYVWSHGNKPLIVGTVLTISGYIAGSDIVTSVGVFMLAIWAMR